MFCDCPRSAPPAGRRNPRVERARQGCFFSWRSPLYARPSMLGRWCVRRNPIIVRGRHTPWRKIRIARRNGQRHNASMEAILEKARNYLDAHRDERVTLEKLASAVGASPFHLQRRFKEAFGVSPRDYQDAHRVEAVKSSLKNGSRVTDAVFEAGYGSVSRFYEKPRLGMTARDYRANGKGQRIMYCAFSSPLGTVLLAATDKGLCSVKLGDNPSQLRRLLADEFSQAEL